MLGWSLRLLRKLHGAGYVEARFFPIAPSSDQFAKFLAVTPPGRRVIEIGSDSPHVGGRTPTVMVSKSRRGRKPDA